MNDVLEDFDCLLCGDTGKWDGSPKPCPECGAFAPLRRNQVPKKWRQKDNYQPIDGGFTGENRKERRRRQSAERRSKRD